MMMMKKIIIILISILLILILSCSEKSSYVEIKIYEEGLIFKLEYEKNFVVDSVDIQKIKNDAKTTSIYIDDYIAMNIGRSNISKNKKLDILVDIANYKYKNEFNTKLETNVLYYYKIGTYFGGYFGYFIVVDKTNPNNSYAIDFKKDIILENIIILKGEEILGDVQ